MFLYYPMRVWTLVCQPIYDVGSESHWHEGLLILRCDVHLQVSHGNWDYSTPLRRYSTPCRIRLLVLEMLIPLRLCTCFLINGTLSVAVIPYHLIITTGTEYDSSTDSRVYIIIMGPQKVQTGRLWLDLPKGKKEFADGSVEKFSVMGLDVGEIKKLEVLCEWSVVTGALNEACFTYLQG